MQKKKKKSICGVYISVTDVNFSLSLQVNNSVVKPPHTWLFVGACPQQYHCQEPGQLELIP